MLAESLRRPASMGLSWQIARWTRVVPGRVGGAFLLALPVLFFFPLGSFGFFDSWRQGSVAIGSLGAVFLGAALGRDSAVPQPTEFWVYQKGLSLADWGIGRWMLDAALALTVIIFWLIVWSFAAPIAGENVTVRFVAAQAIGLLSIYLMTAVMLFAFGSTGSSRGTEFSVVLLFVASVEPVLTRLVPALAGQVVRVVLPPLLPALNARTRLGAGEPIRNVLPALLHVGAFVTILLVVGAMLLARRRPEEDV
jgi:hypothetical protein